MPVVPHSHSAEFASWRWHHPSTSLPTGQGQLVLHPTPYLNTSPNTNTNTTPLIARDSTFFSTQMPDVPSPPPPCAEFALNYNHSSTPLPTGERNVLNLYPTSYLNPSPNANPNTYTTPWIASNSSVCNAGMPVVPPPSCFMEFAPNWSHPSTTCWSQSQCGCYQECIC